MRILIYANTLYLITLKSGIQINYKDSLKPFLGSKGNYNCLMVYLG